ncbi:hypothetical protein BGX23_000503 [Mortierella sp. AD031]|nr:hypothetical protein BGX23_000503 [Mortierella sp. AD031]
MDITTHYILRPKNKTTMQFTTLSKSTLAIFIASLVVLLTQKAEAHSYADCIDWRFKDHKNPSWSDKNGACYGYARRFPINAKPFAKLDSDSPNRHYQQSHENPDPSHSLACSDGLQGMEPGANETMANPISAAYNGKDKRGRKTGAQTISMPGGELCVRWPAKNHAIPSEKSGPVTIALSEVNPKKDPTQLQFLGNIIAKLKYKNCTDRGQNTDTWPCGDCFNLPKDLKPGNFVMQWRWKLNSKEWYTSCADIKVEAPPVSTPTVGVPSKITSALHTPTTASAHRSTTSSASPTSTAASVPPTPTSASAVIPTTSGPPITALVLDAR